MERSVQSGVQWGGEAQPLVSPKETLKRSRSSNEVKVDQPVAADLQVLNKAKG